MARATSIALLAAVSIGAVSAARMPRIPVKRATSVPDYALTYAPYSYLYSGEYWYPTDIAVHVAHCTPEEDYVAVESNVTLETLDDLSSDVYLTSDDDVEDNPTWLLGVEPDSSGYTSAPATIIVADKTDYVDVFYFHFYAYNHGLPVLGSQYGNHVGDWEHIMIRFYDEVPTYIYLSEHSGGSAYDWSAMDFEGDRPITYIATGSHANYATAGQQDYEGSALALLGLYDTTDAGTYWDVTQNYRAYTFDTSSSTFALATGEDVGATEETTEGVDWLYWLGHWGDEQYPDSDPRQDCDLEDITGECHYVDGPTGPYAKNLGRTTVCEDDSDCDVSSSLKRRQE